MIRYVVSYIFNQEFNKVLLIEKKRPVFLAGQMCGIGGKIEDFDESVFHSIQREIKEETDISVDLSQIIMLNSFSNENFELSSFAISLTLEQEEERKNMIDEEHNWYDIEKIFNNDYNFVYSDGVIYCIEQALSDIYNILP